MSITFTPTAGTWTAASYYACDENTSPYDLERAINGVIRFESEEPNLQCHNSGGLWLIIEFKLVPEANIDEGYCGSFPAEAVAELLPIVLNWTWYSGCTEYHEQKVSTFADFLLHCRYHNCGFTWG